MKTKMKIHEKESVEYTKIKFKGKHEWAEKIFCKEVFSDGYKKGIEFALKKLNKEELLSQFIDEQTDVEFNNGEHQL